MIRPNYAEIDLSNLTHNITSIKRSLVPGTKFLAVIKANAYGHGIVQISNAALRCGADYLGVAIPEEGKALREAGITAPILDFGGLLPENAGMIVDYDITPTIFSSVILKAMQKKAEQKDKQLKIHIKVDTGMNRIGIKTEEELHELLDTLKECPNLIFEGMYTHFAVSELPDKSFTMLQAERFRHFVSIVREAGYDPILHASNSGALLDIPELDFDMVRGGLAMYGYYPGEFSSREVELKPVLTWKTGVVHVKDIAPGDTVSYGRNFTAERVTRVATLPVGYGDGYKRSLSNKAEVLIHGKRVPVIGTVCMDQLMVDVSALDDVAVGDEAVLLGHQGEEHIDAEEMAAWADTISYEILLSISERVPRLYR